MTSNKNIYKVTYPIFLTLLAQNIINVTNTAFLGRVGEVELGASAIGGVFYFAIYMIGFGFSQGAQILIGRRNGGKNYRQIGPIFNNSLIFNFILSAAIFGLSVKGVPHIMKLLVSSEHVYKASIEYLDWRIYGFFFSFVSVIFRGLYVGITQTRILTTSAILMAVTNIFFDYTLIFGHFGFPVLGITGAGISSVIAEAVTLGYLVWHTIYRTDRKKYGLLEFKKVELKTILNILNLSIFIMFQYFISISTWFMFFIFIERMGEKPLAVSNIGRSTYILLMIPGSALSTTVNTLVSNLIGAGRKEEVLPFIRRITGIALLIIVPLVLFTLFLPQLIARIYTDDAGLIAACIPVLRVISVAIVFCAVGGIIFSGVSGTGNTRTAFFIEFLTLFFYLSYVYYTSRIHPSPTAVVWMSEYVYWILIGGLGYLYLQKGDWRKREI
ncbi:MAG: MATE family efflux transporter [Bacteroidota bacterium]|nr:MATE family efflux transporter [Bacteroidota bacterium]